jgi:hypothetical protein
VKNVKMLRNCKLYGPKCHAKFASFFAIGAINLAILRSIFTLPNTSLLYPFHRCGILKYSLALERVERLVLDNFDDEHGNVKKSTFSHSTDEVDSQRAAAATEVFMRWLLVFVPLVLIKLYQLLCLTWSLKTQFSEFIGGAQ